MGDTETHQVTRLLAEWSDGSEKALEELMPLVYAELHKMAGRYLNKQGGHTLQTTELIHEAYLKLAGADERNWKNRAHFFGVAAQAMRHILVDYARAKGRAKRGGSPQRITLEDHLYVTDERTDEIVALDDALNELETLDARKSRVVELRFFGGMNTDEIAGVLDVSPNTVKRDWRFARSWLLNELQRG
ncbi:MAG: sigma-70 family RNA polymerase sigma factor [Acidobacteriota bacterium]|nr:MAG: sigma-70 family RNA polymerase sigma factor [Acidobacteriota bacterium]